MAIAPRPNPRPLPTESDASVQALIDEVNDEVKAENLRKFFERYGNIIAAGVILIILAVAGTNTYLNWQRAEQEKDTTVLIALMNRDVATMNDDDLKLMLQRLVHLGKNGHGEGIRFAAGVTEAATLQKKGQKEAALSRLDALSKDSSIQPMYRDFALLQKIRMQVDDGDASKLAIELAPLTEASSPWHVSALQLAAMLDAKQGHMDDAATKLRRILDAQDTPMAAREEAAQLLRLYKAM